MIIQNNEEVSLISSPNVSKAGSGSLVLLVTVGGSSWVAVDSESFCSAGWFSSLVSGASVPSLIVSTEAGVSS